MRFERILVLPGELFRDDCFSLLPLNYYFFFFSGSVAKVPSLKAKTALLLAFVERMRGGGGAGEASLCVGSVV